VLGGLRAYQEAKGLKIDGLMLPGGSTERAMHRQIGVQQKRLIEQVATDDAVKTAIRTGKLPPVLTTKGKQVVADLRLFRVPIHQIDKKDLVKSVKDMLGSRFGKQTIDDLVQDIEEFHRRSRDGEAKPFGIVLLYLASRLRMAQPEA